MHDYDQAVDNDDYDVGGINLVDTTKAQQNITGIDDNEDSILMSERFQNDDDDMGRSVASFTSLMTGSVTTTTTTLMTGRPPIQLYLTCDVDTMSEYQCMIRRQIEFFEANIDDVDSTTQGRNKPINLGQVGIRCRHCSNKVSPKQRQRGACYYPTKLDGIYQSAYNLTSIHLLERCQFIEDSLRYQLTTLRDNNSTASTTRGGGKQMWTERAAALGVYEDLNGLRFYNTLIDHTKTSTL
jgi:hypothetical protein